MSLITETTRGLDALSISLHAKKRTAFGIYIPSLPPTVEARKLLYRTGDIRVRSQQQLKNHGSFNCHDWQGKFRLITYESY